MKDILGQPINVNDVVVSAEGGTHLNLYTVVGFTPQKVRLVQLGHPTDAYYGILRYPKDIAVIPEANNLIQNNLSKR